MTDTARLSAPAFRPRMDIVEHSRPDPKARKELKVSLPSDIRIRLHVTKLLTGRSITDIVQEALIQYFDAAAAQKDEARVAAEEQEDAGEQDF